MRYSASPTADSLLASDSKHKEPAYLFIQWLNSEDISLQRVQLPYALRDPFRDSHYESAEYKARWPEAPQYLAALHQAALTGLLDLSLLQTDRYEEALRQGLSRLWAGEDPKTILDGVAAQWDDITQRVGVDKQKEPISTGRASPTPIPSETGHARRRAWRPPPARWLQSSHSGWQLA